MPLTLLPHTTNTPYSYAFDTFPHTSDTLFRSHAKTTIHRPCNQNSSPTATPTFNHFIFAYVSWNFEAYPYITSIQPQSSQKPSYPSKSTRKNSTTTIVSTTSYPQQYTYRKRARATCRTRDSTRTCIFYYASSQRNSSRCGYWWWCSRWWERSCEWCCE